MWPGLLQNETTVGQDVITDDRSAPEPEDDITRYAVPREGVTERAARILFRDVFAVAEFRALWMAQLLSVIGDQLARVALTVLVYNRTHSALLAAVTFVVGIVPTFIGGVTLAWLADRYPRRAVMIICDVIRAVLVLVMAIPRVPLAAMVALLFVVTLSGAPFNSARAAVFPDVLSGDMYVMGTAVTVTTYQFAQVIGFAVGGTLVAFFGTRTSLVIDAATFAASALLVRVWVQARPAAAAGTHHKPSRLAGIFTGARLVLARPALRTPMLFGLLAAFYNAPEGVAAPLASTLGGGAAAVGVILAANALGQTVGTITFSRFVAPATRLRFMGPLAISACGVLVLFFWEPDLYVSLLILFTSGLCACYQLAANSCLRERSTTRTAKPGLRPSPGRHEPGSGCGDDLGGGRGRASCPGTGHHGMRRCRRRGSVGGHGRCGSRSRLAGRQAPSARLRSGPVVVAHGGLLSGWPCGWAGGAGRGQVQLLSRIAGSFPGGRAAGRVVLVGVRSSCCRASRAPFRVGDGGPEGLGWRRSAPDASTHAGTSLYVHI